MRERITALLLVAVAAIYLLASLAFPFGSAARPGPGLYPVAVGVFLCIAGLLFAVATARRAPVAAAVAVAPTEPGGTTRVATTMAALVAFVLLLPRLGYPVVAFLLVAVLLRRLGGCRWVVATAVGIGSAALTYWVFARLLGVPLPATPLG